MSCVAYFCASAYCVCKYSRIQLRSEARPCKLLPCSDRIFYLAIPSSGYFFAICCHTKSFLSTYPRSWWSYNCFEQKPFFFYCRSDANSGYCRKKNDTLYKNVFFSSCSPGPPHIIRQDLLILRARASPVEFSMCMSQTTSGDPSTVVHPCDTKFGRSQPKRCKNLWLTVALTQWISVPGVGYLYFSVLEERFIMHSAVVAVQLQSLPLLFKLASRCWSITPFYTTPSFSSCTLKFSKRIMDL